MRISDWSSDVCSSDLGDALPNSYFGLVRRLVDACPRLEVVKRSVCIKGARRAFARVKVQWAKLDAVKLIKEGPPQGKEHRTPADRKSVVEGKSVSVRVDIGGRRIYKKKTEQNS